MTATDPARRFNEPGSMLDMWIINPVFANDAPDRPLRGFALGIVRPQAILDGALRRHAHENGLITLDLLDLKPESAPVQLAAYPSKSADDPAVAQPSSFQQIAPLFIFGRTLHIVSQPSPLFYARYSPWMAWLAGLTGLLLATVFTAFVGLVRTRQAAGATGAGAHHRVAAGRNPLQRAGAADSGRGLCLPHRRRWRDEL